MALDLPTQLKDEAGAASRRLNSLWLMTIEAANRRGRANRIENVFRIGASWETVRNDCGLATLVFVRTLQDGLHQLAERIDRQGNAA